MSGVTRFVIAFTLIATAAISVYRLPVGYMPEASTAGLEVEYFPESPWDLKRVGHDVLIPVETAIRSLGGVTFVRGTVGSDGFDLQVELANGSDAERQTARLATELAFLRRKNPKDFLFVYPATISRSDLPMYAFISGDVSPDELKNIKEVIRSVHGVRDVRFWGTRKEEIRVTLGHEESMDIRSLADEMKQRFQVSYVGALHSHGIRFPVLLRPSDPEQIGQLTVGNNQIPLQQLAEITDGLSEAESFFRCDGVSGTGMAILPERSVSLLDFDRSVGDAIRRLNNEFAARPAPQQRQIRILENPAEPARRMIEFALLGLAGFFLAGFGIGFFYARLQGGLVLVASFTVTLAAAANLLWLMRIPLHVVSFCGLAAGLTLGSSIPLLVSFGRVSPLKLLPAVFASLIPAIVLPLVAPQWSLLLGSAAKSFALGVTANWIAALLSPGADPISRPAAPRYLKIVLRDPATALLVFAAISVASLSNYASRLAPSGSGLNTNRKYLFATLRLPDGATLQETEAALRVREMALKDIPGVETFFSAAVGDTANLWVRFDRQHQDTESLRILEQEVRRLCSSGGGVFQLDTSTEANDSDRLHGRELRAVAGKDSGEYRVVLRSVEPEALIAAAEQVQDFVSLRYKLGWGQMQGPFAQSATQIQLGPKPDISAATFLSTVETIKEMTSDSPETFELPGSRERSVVIRSLWSPKKTADLPQLSEVLSRTVSQGQTQVPVSNIVSVKNMVQMPTLVRENGRYVAAVEMQFRATVAVDEVKRTAVDRGLTQLHLPAGVDLERPDLSFPTWTREKLRTVLLVGLAPALLLALSAIVLNSLSRSLAFLIPSAAGLAAGLIPYALDFAQSDAITAFLIVAGICGSTALALAPQSNGSVRGVSTARVYRENRNVSSFALSSIILVVSALLPLLVLSDGREDIWAGPLAGVLAAFAGCVPATVWVAPCVMEVLAGIGRPRPPEVTLQSTDFAMVPVLEASNLVKTYSSGHRALSQVSFALWPGITGLLGPNGAGKTTLLRILTGLVAPTRGSVRFAGARLTSESRSGFRKKVGFLPQEFNAYPDFTGEQFLEYWAIEYGIMNTTARKEEVVRLLELVDLSQDAKRKARDYSGGMLKRLGIARALLGDPEILILDEPTTGLDIQSRHRFREVLLGIAQERIVVLSTHIASDIEAVATRILVLSQGKLLFDGIPTDFVGKVEGQVFETVISDRELLDLSRRYRLTRRVRVLNGIRIRGVVRSGEVLPGKPVEPHLEEAYLAYLGSVEGARR